MAAGKHLDYSVQDGVAVLRYFTYSTFVMFFSHLNYGGVQFFLRFDSPGEKVNSLSEETSAELQDAFHKVSTALSNPLYSSELWSSILFQFE